MTRTLERIAEVWALVGGALLLAIMLVTSLNVTGFALDRLARMFGGGASGLPGYEDFVSLAIGMAALTFLPLCQARRGHVTVDLFTNALPAAARHALDRLWLFAITGLALFLAYWMVFGMLETRADNVLSPVLGWRVWPFYLPGIISLLLWAAIAAGQTMSADTDG
ncbi:MAG: TRAP transporter small permease [Pseudomonadota bacterium]